MSENKTVMFAPNLVCIGIDAYENGDFSGRAWQPYSNEPIAFEGLIDLFLQMDELFDKWEFPQRAQKIRTFAKNDEGNKDEKNLINDKKKRNTTLQDNRGKKDTFIIQVQYRQNSTWQGQVVWAEQNKKEHFRSALELMKLIDSATASAKSDEEQQDQDQIV